MRQGVGERRGSVGGCRRATAAGGGQVSVSTAFPAVWKYSEKATTSSVRNRFNPTSSYPIRPGPWVPKRMDAWIPSTPDDFPEARSDDAPFDEDAVGVELGQPAARTGEEVHEVGRFACCVEERFHGVDRGVVGVGPIAHLCVGEVFREMADPRPGQRLVDATDSEVQHGTRRRRRVDPQHPHAVDGRLGDRGRRRPHPDGHWPYIGTRPGAT